ncbi:MAG: TadE/TadG family type IV pilus assembly protein [Bradyrhizobium sp.]|jgi:Flp pilus assembly protein TadG
MRSFLSVVWCRAAEMRHDCRAIAATEFAVIVPLMLVMFFGTVEFSSGVAVDRKLTIVARTLSDLTSQSPPSSPNSVKSTVDDNYLQNIFTASIAILQPYSPTPVKAQLSEIYVDSNKVAKVQWSKAATIGSGATQATLATSTRTAGDVVSLPTQLAVKQTYLIFSEVSYLYIPIIGYVMAKTGVNLKDVTYTRPRQVACVVYNGVPAAAPNDCPTP